MGVTLGKIIMNSRLHKMDSLDMNESCERQAPRKIKLLFFNKI